MCSSIPACRLVAVPTVGLVVDERLEVPMIAHQTDMLREEHTTSGAGRASTVERSSRIAPLRCPVPYAVSYPAVGRHRVGLGRHPSHDGRIRASIRRNSPKRNLFSSIETGRDDAASGPGVCHDFARMGSVSLGAPRENRIFATGLRICSAATIVPKAFSLHGLNRRSCSVAPFRR